MPTPVHTVEPQPGYYRVTSGHSGNAYVVTPLGGDRANCTCVFGRRSDGDRVCSHIRAVREFAAAVVRERVAEAKEQAMDKPKTFEGTFEKTLNEQALWDAPAAVVAEAACYVHRELVAPLVEALRAAQEEMLARPRHDCAGWDCATCVSPAVRAQVDEALAAYEAKE